MSTNKRGPERRGHSDDGFGEDQRAGSDRRRSGFISNIDLFRGVPYDAIEPILERCPVQTVRTGEILLELGQKNHFLYLLLDGHLEVHLDTSDSPPAYDINPGECVGEISIIDGEPTSACVRATTDSRLVVVHQSVFWEEFAPLPATVRNLLSTLSSRMRRRNEVTLRALEQELRYQQLKQELEAAYEIQVAMLPRLEPLQETLENVELAARMAVVKQVGGDFYDAFMLDTDHLCLVVGDVSGKGMPAALLMVRTVTLLRDALILSGDLVASIDELNKTLCASDIPHMFVSLFALIVDLRDGSVDFVNAGHNPPIIRGGDGDLAIVDDPKSLIVGVLTDAEYRLGQLQLEPHDRVLMYTDGVTEARDKEGRFYSLERLGRFFKSRPEGGASALVEHTFDDVQRFARGAAQTDDITLLGMTYAGPAA